MAFSHWEIHFYLDERPDRLPIGGDSILKDLPIDMAMKLIMSDPNTPYKSEDDIAEAITQSAREYADEIYKKLQQEYEWLCSDVVMLEHFENNDINFDEEGEVLCFGTIE